MTELLKVNQLKTYFFTQMGIVRAVDDVSLTVNRKDVVGLVGESGCGKTMTMMSIVRLVPPPGKTIAGEIFFDGVDLLKISQDEMRKLRGKGISMIFQDPMTYLNPVMRVKDQIAEAVMRDSRTTKKEANLRAIQLLEDVRIASPREVAANYPHQLSGGMRQRVLIAIALACRPKLIIADEPTTALDTTVQKQIIDLMGKLASDLGTSLLIVTHNLALTAEICDRVYIMYAGEIVEGADVYTIFENPVHPYTRLLMKCVPRVDETTTIQYIPGMVPDLTHPPKGCRFHTRCPNAEGKCSRETPSLMKMGEGHIVACWVP